MLANSPNHPKMNRGAYSAIVARFPPSCQDPERRRFTFGPMRVMRTCGMMGEIVGKAAWIARRHDTDPRGVYQKHLELLKELMAQPGSMRRDKLDGELVPAPHEGK